MVCSLKAYKNFLIGCNVALLFVGLSIFILGLKMKLLLSMLQLIGEPMIADSVKAIIATGFFITLAGATGIASVCYETRWLILVNLGALGVIVVMEFSLGVTLLIVRNSIEKYLTSIDCDTSCAATLDTLVLDYALPSAGLMLTIIIVEAMMIFSAMKLYVNVRDAPKVVEPISANAIDQRLFMGRIDSPYSGYNLTPRHTYSPRLDPMSVDMQPAYAMQAATPRYSPQSASPISQQYSTLALEEQQPPTYYEAVPSAQFNVPSAQFNVPSAQFNVPSAQFNVPSAQFNVPLLSVGETSRAASYSAV